MSEIMRPIPFGDLVKWAQQEYRQQGSVFGIRKEKFYRNKTGSGVTLLGTRLASPLGPAAGPNSQLAQNILAAYLAGSRFIELKTVQIMDGEELRKCVPRPCINAEDEGYNVEWSTELTVGEAFGEYVKAWFLLHVFGKEFGISDACIPDNCDFIFNMSVGYNLEGIQSPKIDGYIEGMRNAKDSAVWKECYSYLAAHIDSFRQFNQKDLDAVSNTVSSSITLSTLHGCPREEIEKIAAYLITNKGLHTYIKCNPTLLGYEKARRILDDMGYGYISFDDHHFKDDLQFNDAVDMIGRLQSLAKEKNVAFGVKLTNTFPVEIKRQELPGQEMYMSGRALFPLSINVAKDLSAAFKGELPISYSGGADYFNLAAILETGIRPVTVATTVLKPGGYERINQLAGIAEKILDGTSDTLSAGGRDRPPESNPAIKVEVLNKLVATLGEQKRFHKEYRHTGLRKTASPLPLFDCAKAPCMDGGCPIHQRIPEYLAQVAQENYREAFKIIAADNTAPSITGTICDHQCQNKCTRVDYEDPLEIREAKKIAAGNAQEAYIQKLTAPPLKTDRSVAVIGAGPAGLAAAVFLRRNGVPVQVYEKRDKPYGIVRYVIPSFRIPEKALDLDYGIAEKMGVKVSFGAKEHYSVEELKKKHTFVVIAAGAWKEGASPVKEGAENVVDALAFLEDSKKSNLKLKLGKHVGVIGGGDVAMDCARAARRNAGVEKVTVVYRRTVEFMPAQSEERELALEDGVEILELHGPETYVDGVLTCEVMRLADYDESGRRGITGTGKKVTLRFDTLIGAVGARVDTEPFVSNGIALNSKGCPKVNGTNESSVENVYLAGDCKDGAATVVKAIADGKITAADILRKLGLSADFASPNEPVCAAAGAALGFSEAVGVSIEDLYFRKGIIVEGRKENTDAYRCLSCNTLCEICADVCPNRANVMVIDKNGAHQIIHIDRMCNECGNCAVFCPHAGKPYRDKFTVFSREEDFIDSDNAGFLKTGADTFKVRLEDKSVVDYRKDAKSIPHYYISLIDSIVNRYPYLLAGSGIE
ncbi:putative selenate reductase subunit YgfK [Spirochaetia bacterium]|nr:putative selenate reductase subunit YgfK [Spirochaetia bacterium]